MKSILYLCLVATVWLFFQCQPEPIAPSLTASFTMRSDSNCTQLCSVSFVNTSQLAQSYRWSFGDGQTSTEPNPVHQYSKPAISYLVSLTAINEQGYKVAQNTLNFATSLQHDRAYGGANDDFLTTVIQTADGGYLLAGSSDSDLSVDKTAPNKGELDYWIVKTDSEGKRQWDKTYGGNKRDELTSITPTSDGGYLLLGASESGVSGDRTVAHFPWNDPYQAKDEWLLKVDANGQKQWDRTYQYIGNSNNHSSRYRAILSGLDGSFYVAGAAYLSFSSDTRPLNELTFAKIDKDGKEVWKKRYGLGGANESLTTALKTPDNGFLLVGYTSALSPSILNYFVVKIDSDGNEQWYKILGEGGNNGNVYGCLTNDGGYLIGGASLANKGGDKSDNSVLGSFDYWVVKLNNAGQKVWDNTYGTEQQDYLRHMTLTADGGFSLTGSTGVNGALDYWIVRIDGTGRLQWQKTIRGNNNDEGVVAFPGLNGNYLIGGSSTSESITGYDKSTPSRGKTDFWIVNLKR